MPGYGNRRFRCAALLPDRTAKLQPNAGKMAVFRGLWRNLARSEARISGGRQTLVDSGGMLLNRIHMHEVAGSRLAPPADPASGAC